MPRSLRRRGFFCVAMSSRGGMAPVDYFHRGRWLVPRDRRRMGEATLRDLRRCAKAA